jgi:hypothetical protein
VQEGGILTYFEISEECSEFLKSELKVIFQGVDSVLKTWARTSTRYIGIPMEERDPLPLEVSTVVSGLISGILNIRTTPDMARVLLMGSSVKRFSEEEIFRQFLVVLSGRLSAHFQGKNRGVFVSNIPRVSTAGNPTESQTIGCCAFVVENWPVEVRVTTEKLTARNETTRLSQAGSLKTEVLC